MSESAWPEELLGPEDSWSLEHREALASAELKGLGIYASWSLASRAWGWALLGCFAGALVGAVLARLGLLGGSETTSVWLWGLVAYPLIGALPLYLAGRRRGLMGAARALSYRDELLFALAQMRRQSMAPMALGTWLWGREAAAAMAALEALYERREASWWTEGLCSEELTALRGDLDRDGQLALGRAFWFLVVVQSLLPAFVRYFGGF